MTPPRVVYTRFLPCIVLSRVPYYWGFFIPSDVSSSYLSRAAAVMQRCQTRFWCRTSSSYFSFLLLARNHPVDELSCALFVAETSTATVLVLFSLVASFPFSLPNFHLFSSLRFCHCCLLFYLYRLYLRLTSEPNQNLRSFSSLSCPRRTRRQNRKGPCSCPSLAPHSIVTLPSFVLSEKSHNISLGCTVRAIIIFV